MEISYWGYYKIYSKNIVKRKGNTLILVSLLILILSYDTVIKSMTVDDIHIAVDEHIIDESFHGQFD